MPTAKSDLTRQTAQSVRRGRQSGFELQRQFIGQRIKEALQGMPIIRVAEQMAISRQTVYDWISGKALPDVERLNLLATVSSTNLAWLVAGVGPQRPGDAPVEGYVVPQSDPSLASALAPVAFETKWLVALAQEFYGSEESDFHPYLFRVRDDSMEMTLRPGNLLLISHRGLVVGRRPAIYNGRAVEGLLPRDGLWLFDAGQVWRVQWIPDADTFSALIRKDNKLYGSEPRIITVKELPTVVGPVVLRIGQV